MTERPAPRLTVVSAWFNRTEDLELSVRSVLDQEGVDFDYVIVDDCSTDETSALLAALSHPRLRVIRNPRNLGFTRSIARAVQEARGTYVAMHDAGDLSLPGRLAAQVAFLDANPDHVAVGTRVENHFLATGRRAPAVFAKMESGGNPYTHGEVMYRRAAYEQVGGYRPVFYYAQDNDLWRRMGELGRLGRVETQFYERRVFADGVEGNPIKQALQAMFSNLSTHAAQERAAGRRDPVDRMGAAALLTQTMTARFKNKGTTMIRSLLKQRRYAETKALLETVPLGLLTWKLLLLYLVLAPFHRRPPMRPVPPVETWRSPVGAAAEATDR